MDNSTITEAEIARSRANPRFKQALKNYEEALALLQQINLEGKDDAYKTAIQKVVASQNDKTAYCRLIMSLIDGGQYDLTIRDDLKQPLKRIFPQ